MDSPFPKSTSAAGKGSIVVKLLPNGESGLETVTYQYPLKLISPSRSAETRSALVFLLSYGGGLVGGDVVDLSIDIQVDARLSVVTQGHTKIFISAKPDIVTRQTLQVRIADGAALCLLPDPVQPFADSVYQQTQIFRLAGTASLCFLDWVTQGRVARGEDWSFVKWVGKNEVWAAPGDNSEREGRLLVRDTVILDKNRPELEKTALRDTMHGLAVFGTLILRGPLTTTLGNFFLAEFAALPRIGARDFRSVAARELEEKQMSAHEVWRASRLKMERDDKVLWSAANVRGCVVVKFGASTVEAGRVWLGSMIVREGSISSHFGDQALMCVR